MTNNKRILIALTVSVIAFSLLSTAYFLLTNTKNEKTRSLEIVLAENDTSVITDEDVISYNGTSHELRLTQNGAAKIGALKIPLAGTQFMIKIDGQRICNGTFMTPISSYSAPPSDVVIETFLQNDTFRLQNGYPPNQPANIEPKINTSLTELFQSLGKLLE